MIHGSPLALHSRSSRTGLEFAIICCVHVLSINHWYFIILQCGADDDLMSGDAEALHTFT